MKNILKLSQLRAALSEEKPRPKYRFFLSRSRTALPRGAAALAVLGALLAALQPSAALGASVFLDSSTEGNQVAVNTPYGPTIYMAQPGISTNSDFKVENVSANWSKDDISGFSPGADAPPKPLYELPVVTLGGIKYIGIGVDFNESGTAADFDVINLMLWVGPESAQSTQVATLSDPDISSFTWSSTATNQEKNSWQNNLRQMNLNPAAIGFALVYQQNASPSINAPGDAHPYGSDPYRVFSAGMDTLGSNRADLAILVPYDVLNGQSSSDLLYLGLQTGSLADAGSDRVGFLDPNSIIAGGYFDDMAIEIATNIVEPGTTIEVPEVSTSALALLAGAIGLLRRRRHGT